MAIALSLRGAAARLIAVASLLAPAGSPAEAQPGTRFRTRMPVLVADGTQILSRDRKPIRTARAGEILTVAEIDGDHLWCTSTIPALGDGLIPAAAATPATREQLLAWTLKADSFDAETAGGAAETRAARRQALGEADRKLPARPPFLLPEARAATGLGEAETIAGFLDFADRITVSGVTPTPDGSLILAGVCEGFRGGSLPVQPRKLDGTSPGAAGDLLPPHAFLLRLDPTLRKAVDLILISDFEMSSPTWLRSDPQGNLFLAARGIVGLTPTEDQRMVAVSDADPTQVLVKFDPQLKGKIWTYGFPSAPGVFADLQIDGSGRPFCLFDHGRRFSVPALTGLYAGGETERPWPAWGDGQLTRIPLDVKLPEFAKGPLAPWAAGSQVYPKLGTPIGPFGSPDNAGQPIRWTNVRGGKNPIPVGSASLVAQRLAIGLDGSLFVACTMPFVMPMPDFEPVLMRFSPEGRLLWTNVLIEGLLSEPDQKCQAIRIDPSNGDVIVTYWEHGENVHTLIKDPRGFLREYGGKSGNLKVSWIGRIDAASGRLKSASYLFGRSLDTVDARRPQVTSLAIEDLGVDRQGRIYVTGGGLGVLPTTPDARIPSITTHGGRPFLMVFSSDLSTLCHATYLSPGGGGGTFLHPAPDGTVAVVGTTRDPGAFKVEGAEKTNFLATRPRASTEARAESTFVVLTRPELSPKAAQWRLEKEPEPATGTGQIR